MCVSLSLSSFLVCVYVGWIRLCSRYLHFKFWNCCSHSNCVCGAMWMCVGVCSRYENTNVRWDCLFGLGVFFSLSLSLCFTQIHTRTATLIHWHLPTRKIYRRQEAHASDGSEVEIKTTTTQFDSIRVVHHVFSSTFARTEHTHTQRVCELEFKHRNYFNNNTNDNI